MKHLLVAGMLLAAVPALAADPLPRAAPDTLGFSPDRLARIGSTIDAE
ncbi:MAG: serine hydrolase, partial [Acetobacteraceae bacterium]